MRESPYFPPRRRRSLRRQIFRLALASACLVGSLAASARAQADGEHALHLGAFGGAGVGRIGSTPALRGVSGVSLSVGAVATYRALRWLDVQARLSYLFYPHDWVMEESLGVLHTTPSADSARYVLFDLTARARPLGGPFFFGLGAQAGARFVRLNDLVGGESLATIRFVPNQERASAVVRGVAETGVRFGPHELLEIAVRFALGPDDVGHAKDAGGDLSLVVGVQYY